MPNGGVPRWQVIRPTDGDDRRGVRRVAGDVRVGRTNILVTEATQSVTELNQRARAERLLDSDAIAGHEVNLGDGTQASEGDIVITRRNDRRLQMLRGGWVRNGDRWRVEEVNQDGSMRVRRLGFGVGGEMILPAAYAAEHVELGYATTATVPRASPSTRRTSSSPGPRPARASTCR